jgi:pimeloyl-ACP methyl ester carboxylesterase
MWIDVEQGRLYVEITGSGPPLLTVHGWPLDHRVFAPQVSGLSSSLTVIAYDRRGFGRSEARPDLSLEVDDIDRILDALELPSVHLLGMSQGGRIALRYAATHSHRLRSLLLQGAVIDGLLVEEPDADRIPIAGYAALAKSGRLDEVRRRWLRHPMMQLGAGFEAASDLLVRILADYAGADLIDFDANRYRFPADLLTALSALNMPALLLTGAHETGARKRHADEIESRVAGCVRVQLENSGHLSNLTEPERYNRAVREFCEEVETAGGLL